MLKRLSICINRKELDTLTTTLIYQIPSNCWAASVLQGFLPLCQEDSTPDISTFMMLLTGCRTFLFAIAFAMFDEAEAIQCPSFLHV
jgi:hypothetical protein